MQELGDLCYTVNRLTFTNTTHQPIDGRIYYVGYATTPRAAYPVGIICWADCGHRPGDICARFWLDGRKILLPTDGYYFPRRLCSADDLHLWAGQFYGLLQFLRPLACSRISLQSDWR